MKRNLTMLVIGLALAGCSFLSDPLGAGDYAGYGVGSLSADGVTATNKAVNEVLRAGGIEPADFQACVAVTAPDPVCSQRRNQVVSIMVLASEDQCVRHRRSIYGKEASFNIVAGSLTNLFSGWAALAPGERGKSILAALALFSNSERSLVNELVYKSVVVPSVDKKILQLRETKARGLLDHFSKPIATYPMAAAIRDTLDFHYSCSFMTGLQKALEEGTQETGKQKAERLKRDLTLLEEQMKAASVKGDIFYKNLEDRYMSMHEEIKTLEKQ